jgi:hypothetical protein
MNTTTNITKHAITAAALAAGLISSVHAVDDSQSAGDSFRSYLPTPIRAKQASAAAVNSPVSSNTVTAASAATVQPTAAASQAVLIPPIAPVSVVSLNTTTYYPGTVMMQIWGGPFGGSAGVHYVSASGGGDHFPDALNSAATAPTAQDQFQVEQLRNGQVRFKTETGNYISAVQGGGYPQSIAADSMFTYEISPDNTALFAVGTPWDYNSNGTPIFAAAFGYEIRTYNEDYFNAVGGGGLSTGAFYTNEAVTGSTSSPTVYTFNHCGDLGTGFVYNVSAWFPSDPFGHYNPIFANYGGGLDGVNAFTSFFAGGSSNYSTNANFKLIKQPDGSYAMQTGDGKHYVTAENGGGLYPPQSAGPTLVTNRTAVGAWETFRFADQGNCVFTIQVADGNFLAYSDAYGFSTDASAPPGGRLGAGNGYTPFFVITPVF